MHLRPRPTPRRLPVLPIGGSVSFPGNLHTLELPERWVAGALRDAPQVDDLCLAVALRDPVDDPDPASWFPTATLARIVSAVRLADGRRRVVLQGMARALPEAPERTPAILDTEYRGYSARCHVLEDSGHVARPDDLIERFLDRLATLREADPRFGLQAGNPWEANDSLEETTLGESHDDLARLLAENASDPGTLSDLAAARLPLSFPQRCALLTETDPVERLTTLSDILAAELVRARAGGELEGKVAQRIRRDYLREKLAALRLELDEPDSHAAEVASLHKRLESAPLSRLARRGAQRELALFGRTSPTSPEAARIRNYLEWLLELPWNDDPRSRSPRRFEPVVAALHKSHVGLADVKQRIVEFLAVRKLGGGARGTVLCFVGPPGTGKSSMGRALAKALNRAFVVIPVGGMTEEGEIAGFSHKSEAGAPGAILAGLHRSGTRNPVLLLDEIDKLSLGAEGESSGALLQLLDPEQNADFLDRYLGVPFDVSECLFLATANDVGEIPEALSDRMEIIEFSGYTESEKLKIARDHLLPRALEHAGLRKEEFSLSTGALRAIQRSYTEEAGVRQLQRVLMALARKAAVNVVQNSLGIRVRMRDLPRFLGPHRTEEDMRHTRPAIGVATGLAWTSVGGSLLPIEALAMPGGGNLILTGQVGEVLRESVQTVISYLRHAWRALEFPEEPLSGVDLHLHFPSAATPKDGPSAGVAITTALVSLFSARPARHDVAMTGEVSLRGAVLPVGGIREKCLAALRNGIRVLVLPARNAEEARRLPSEVLEGLTIHTVDHVHEAVQIALSPTTSGSRPKSGTRRRRGPRPEDSSGGSYRRGA